MHKRLIVIAFLAPAATFGQTKSFDATACARFAEDSLVNGSVPHYVPEECYPVQTFDLSHNVTPERIREIVQILKISLDFVSVEVDASAFTLTVHGGPKKLAATNWLLGELDQPAPKTGPRMDQYAISPVLRKEENATWQAVSVFSLSHIDNRGIEELIAVFRLVGEVPRLASDDVGHKLVVRGTEAQLAIANYLVDALDVAPGSSTAVPDFSSGAEVIRTFFPGRGVAFDRQILTALRNVVEIKNVFNFTASAAIAVRGTTDQIAAADWLIRSLESPLRGCQPDNVMKVFYQPHAKIDTLKSSAFDSPAALLVRGSASQIVQAEREMQ